MYALLSLAMGITPSNVPPSASRQSKFAFKVDKYNKAGINRHCTCLVRKECIVYHAVNGNDKQSNCPESLLDPVGNFKGRYQIIENADRNFV